MQGGSSYEWCNGVMMKLLHLQSGILNVIGTLDNTGIPGVPRVLGPVSELWDGSLNSGVGTPEFWGTSDAFCVVLA